MSGEVRDRLLYSEWTPVVKVSDVMLQVVNTLLDDGVILNRYGGYSDAERVGEKMY